MNKPSPRPRLGPAVLAEDIDTGIGRPPREAITWVQQPATDPGADDEPTAESEEP